MCIKKWIKTKSKIHEDEIDSDEDEDKTDSDKDEDIVTVHNDTEISLSCFGDKRFIHEDAYRHKKYNPSIGPNHDPRFRFQTYVPGFGFGSDPYPKI